MSFLSEYKDPGFAADTRRFWKFKTCNVRNGHWKSHGNSNFFIGADKSGKNKTIYITGIEGNGYLGLGVNRTDSLWAFTPIGLPPELEPGEFPEEIYEHINSLFIVTNYRNLYSMGSNSYGILGLGDTTARPTFQKVTTFDKNIAKFAVSTGLMAGFCYVITTSGQLYSWGFNDDYNLGFRSNTTVTTPSAVTVGSVSSVQIKEIYPFQGTESYNNGYGMVIDINDEVHAVGVNGYGQLGTGNAVAQNTGFVRLSGFKAEKIYGSLYSNTGTTFALSANRLWGTGYNNYGQLGTGDTNTVNRFTLAGLVSALPIQEIEIGHYYGSVVMAILTGGEVVGWGRNTETILGDGSAATTRTTSFYNFNEAPSSLGFGLTGDRAIKIRITGASSPTAYILTSNGKIYTTGDNLNGGRGVGESTQPSSNLTRFGKATLAPHPYNLKFTDLTVWGSYSNRGCTAVDENGEVWSIGSNNEGQAGTRFSITGYQDGAFPSNFSPQVWHKCTIREGQPFGVKALFV